MEGEETVVGAGAMARQNLQQRLLDAVKQARIFVAPTTLRLLRSIYPAVPDPLRSETGAGDRDGSEVCLWSHSATGDCMNVSPTAHPAGSLLYVSNGRQFSSME